jgi:hypothetical protein
MKSYEEGIFIFSLKSPDVVNDHVEEEVAGARVGVVLLQVRLADPGGVRLADPGSGVLGVHRAGRRRRRNGMERRRSRTDMVGISGGY